MIQVRDRVDWAGGSGPRDSRGVPHRLHQPLLQACPQAGGQGYDEGGQQRAGNHLLRYFAIFRCCCCMLLHAADAEAALQYLQSARIRTRD